MKKVFSILMIVLLTTAMVACKKDKPKPDENNGGNNDAPAATEAAANTLVLNGTVYHLNSHYQYSAEQDRSYAGASTVETDANGDPLYDIISDVENFCLNRTLDLTTAYDDASYYFAIHNSMWSEQIFQDYHVGNGFYGMINDVDYGEDSIFSSGTLTVSKDDNAFTYKVTGVLKNGKSLSFHIYVPASEWNAEEY